MWEAQGLVKQSSWSLRNCKIPEWTEDEYATQNICSCHQHLDTTTEVSQYSSQITSVSEPNHHHQIQISMSTSVGDPDHQIQISMSTSVGDPDHQFHISQSIRRWARSSLSDTHHSEHIIIQWARSSPESDHQSRSTSILDSSAQDQYNEFHWR